MSKYINADCLIKELEEQKLTYKSTASTMLLDYMIGLLRVIPAEDVVPVVHGRWSMVKMGENRVLAKCSACGRKMNPSQYGYAYCGLCGAKMDGGE